MNDRQPCVRCGRTIDAFARICPYCNWDQSKPAPMREAVPVPIEVAEYRPPEEQTLKQKLMIAGAGVLILLSAFVSGMIINRDGTPKNAPEPVAESAANAPTPDRVETSLILTNEPGGIEQPITSAPASGPVPGAPSNQWDRRDATAVSSAEYAQLARRAQAERKIAPALVDPRSLTGAAYAQEPRRRASESASAPHVARTRPVPEFQGLPRLRTQGTAILDLTIGPDGHVTDIDVRRPAEHGTGMLISAVQRWRFKPATLNGEPISSAYSVQISFKDHE